MDEIGDEPGTVTVRSLSQSDELSVMSVSSQRLEHNPPDLSVSNASVSGARSNETIGNDRLGSWTDCCD